ncbi:MAG TPA: HU family DNA-binding protein [Firmicutes bacterium]|nr:HU family DNA-binding protein [Bacillota bacterium]
MNKSELIAEVADATNLTKKKVGEIIEVTLDTIAKALAEGDKVTLVGFGTFEVRSRKSKRGVNPVTKEPIQIPASKNAAFRPSKQLKEMVK